jgi:membrane dipeptidase
MINFYPAYIDERAAAQGRDYFAKHGAALGAILSDPDLVAAERRRRAAAHFEKHPAPQTSLDVLLDHFDHAIAVAGADHVGLGADWDGVASMPVGMEEIADLPRLTEGLLARGHSPDAVRKVLGENLLRVLERAEEVARNWTNQEGEDG